MLFSVRPGSVCLAFYPVDPAALVLVGGLYLYGMWSERRRRRRGSPTTEENEPLSNGSSVVSDCEKGGTKASKNKDEKNDGDDDRMVRPPNTRSCEIPLTAFPYRFHHRHTLTNRRKRQSPMRVRLRQISLVMVTTDLRVSLKPTHSRNIRSQSHFLDQTLSSIIASPLPTVLYIFQAYSGPPDLHGQEHTYIGSSISRT